MTKARKWTVVGLLSIGFLGVVGFGLVNWGMRYAAAKRQMPLHQIGLMYHSYMQRQGHGPATADDLQPWAAENSLGYEALRSGQCTIIWKGDFTNVGRNGDAFVLGYESDVPANGGYVLLASGVVRHMSQGEFQTFPKVKAADNPGQLAN